MRRICWPLLALFLLLSLVGCDLGEPKGGDQSMASATPSPTQQESNILLPTPQPTSTPTPIPTPTSIPTPRSTPTSPSSTPKHHTTSGLIGTNQEKLLQQQLFSLINQDRASQSLRPYALNSTLSSGARLHSQKMSVCGMTHQCPDEDEPCTRVSNEGISWTSCGENVGYTSPNPTDWGGVKKIEQNMLAEQPPDDGHRQNLLSTSFSRVGVGIFIDASGIVWMTEDFAS